MRAMSTLAFVRATGEGSPLELAAVLVVAALLVGGLYLLGRRTS
jgi:hypothetical protein